MNSSTLATKRGRSPFPATIGVSAEGQTITTLPHTFLSPAVSVRIEALMAGYLDFEVRRRRILAFKLATSKATADGHDFLAGITSQPKIYTEPAEE